MNTLERYGLRDKDTASLHPLMAVLGVRHVTQALDNAIAPHSMPFFQILYVDEGELDWWIDGRFYHLSPGDLLLVKPYETQNSLQGRIPIGRRYFMQINLYEQNENEGLSQSERDQVNKLFTEFIPRVLHMGDDFSSPFQKILEAHRKPDNFSSLHVKSQLLEIFYALHKAQEQHLHDKHVGHSDAIEILVRVDQYIKENIDRTISINNLAELFSLSEVHFRRKFLAASGLSPLKYLNHKKCNEARRLLSETNKSMSEIAAALAYSSSQHFSTSFSKAFALSPREYRQAVKDAQQQQPLSKTSDVAAHIASHFTRT